MRDQNSELTEREIQKEIVDMERVMSLGEGTVTQANRLAELRRQLRRIQAVRYDKQW